MRVRGRYPYIPEFADRPIELPPRWQPWIEKDLSRGGSGDGDGGHNWASGGKDQDKDGKEDEGEWSGDDDLSATILLKPLTRSGGKESYDVAETDYQANAATSLHPIPIPSTVTFKNPMTNTSELEGIMRHAHQQPSWKAAVIEGESWEGTAEENIAKKRRSPFRLESETRIAERQSNYTHSVSTTSVTTVRVILVRATVHCELTDDAPSHAREVDREVKNSTGKSGRRPPFSDGIAHPEVNHSDALASIPRSITALIYQNRSLPSARQFVHSYFLAREIDLRSMIKFRDPKKALLEMLGEGFGSSLKMAEFRAAEDALHRVYLIRTPNELIQLPTSTFPLGVGSVFSAEGKENAYTAPELVMSEITYSSSGKSSVLGPRRR
ncbi:hypothetical protein D9615_003603 [Tricholomella constricta]|uniref:DRBM domain-containing protein n=1 Tax=Tricholomella constricta TaxID=117010 RepID=A0A8H5HHM7_9AGAR|nr:hypothetical protein D9615_003603 [Tricholomella constricta]